MQEMLGPEFCSVNMQAVDALDYPHCLNLYRIIDEILEARKEAGDSGSTMFNYRLLLIDLKIIGRRLEKPENFINYNDASL
jgi:hypothetical protein